MLDKYKGPALIALAALLWATDAPFRAPLAHQMDVTLIVLMEHLVGGAVLFVWVMLRNRSELFKLKPLDWVLAFIVGAGAAALATLLFTASLAHLNPSVVILLQKLQPIFVVLIAYALLKERPEGSFYGWAALALAAAIFLTLPHLHVQTLLHQTSWESKSVLYAVAAAALWGASTVFGKILLQRHSPSVVTFWRYAFGALALIVLFAVSPSTGAIHALNSFATLKSLLYLSLVSGLLSMVLYYRGLSQTSASTATFAELTYPVSAVLFNAWFLGATLSPLQAAAATVLIFSVLRISS